MLLEVRISSTYKEKRSFVVMESEHDISLQKIEKIEIIALFTALSFFLSSLEYLLPRPVPFFRYGLANIAVLLGLRAFDFKDIFLLALLKVMGLGILNGTFLSYVILFSFLGTMSSLLCMCFLVRLLGNKISLIGLSVCGALISNIVQIACAILYIFGVQSWIIAPYLLLLGSVSGITIGILSQYYWNNSKLLHTILVAYRRERNEQ